MAKVAIIVLNWNRAQDTIECLNSLLPILSNGAVSIICCDNGSTDESAVALLDWAERHFQSTAPNSADGVAAFALLRTAANLGYAAGNNTAIRYALSSDNYEFVWILNNDTVVACDALASLINFAERHPKAGAIGSTIASYQRPERIQCAGGCRYLPLLTIMWNVYGASTLQEVLHSKANEPRLDYICGAAMLLRVAAIKKIGLLNEDFFLYYEEADYAKRLQSNGYDIKWCRNSLVYHKGGVSTGSRVYGKVQGSFVANYHENLSTLLFTAQHYPYLLPFAAAFRLLMKTGVFLVFCRYCLFRPLFMAYRDFFNRGRSLPRPTSSLEVLFRGNLHR